MAGNVTNTLVANISTQEDTTSNVPINRSTGNPSFDCGNGDFNTYKTLLAGANSIPIPNGSTRATQVYIRNLDSANSITVAWAGNLTASATVIILNPGDQIILWCDPTKTNPGITSLNLTPSAAPCLCEYFIGG